VHGVVSTSQFSPKTGSSSFDLFLNYSSFPELGLIIPSAIAPCYSNGINPYYKSTGSNNIDAKKSNVDTT
jgi:hypothetical protein